MSRCTPASAHSQRRRQPVSSKAESREDTGKSALAGSHPDRAATRRLPRLGSRRPPRPLGLQGEAVSDCLRAHATSAGVSQRAARLTLGRARAKRALAGSHRAATRRLPRLGSRGPPRPLGLQGRQGVIPCVVCALHYPHEGHCPLDGPRRAGLSRRLVATASRSHAPTPSSGESRSSLATRATREAVSESLCGVRKALST